METYTLIPHWSLFLHLSPIFMHFPFAQNLGGTQWVSRKQSNINFVLQDDIYVEK